MLRNLRPLVPTGMPADYQLLMQVGARDPASDDSALAEKGITKAACFALTTDSELSAAASGGNHLWQPTMQSCWSSDPAARPNVDRCAEQQAAHKP